MRMAFTIKLIAIPELLASLMHAFKKTGEQFRPIFCPGVGRMCQQAAHSLDDMHTISVQPCDLKSRRSLAFCRIYQCSQHRSAMPLHIGRENILGRRLRTMMRI
jgi:hypothetical protein